MSGNNGRISANMELKLVVAVGEPKGKEITISQERTLIGRKPECDIVIASPKVSREHCRIDLSGDTAEIVDLGSRNGIFVNGQKAKRAILSSGDRISVGPLGFIVSSADAAQAGGGAQESLTLTEQAPEGDVSQDINDFLAQLENRNGGGSSDDEDIIELK